MSTQVICAEARELVKRAAIARGEREPLWKVEVRERDARGRIRWYCLAWTGNGGPAPGYLTNGRTMARYRFKRDALARAAELNKGA